MGAGALPQYKKILVALPPETIEGIDEFSAIDGVSRSEFIRQGLCECLAERRRKRMREELKKGYSEMGRINLSLAEMCFEADNDTQMCYEEKLSECEN